MENKFEYIEETYNEAIKFIDEGKNVCVVNPCGSGKSIIMKRIVEKYLPTKSIIIFTKQKNAKKYYESLNPIFKTVKIVTYSMMCSEYEKNIIDYEADIYLLDEAHYIGANKWGYILNDLKSLFNPIFVGFTATPQRYEHQGTEESIISLYFDKNVAGNFSVKYLQEKEVFVEPEYILSLYNLEAHIDNKKMQVMECDELLESEKEDLIQKLDKTFEHWKDFGSPEKVIKEKLPEYLYKKKSNRILVYMSSVKDIEEHADEVTKWIKKAVPRRKIQSYIYTYKTSSNEFDEFMKEDNNYIKILFSVNKIIETIHIDDLNVEILLRSTNSNRIIIQQHGRLNNIHNKNKSLIIDMVNNTLKLPSEKNIIFSDSNINKEVVEKKPKKVTPPSLELTYYNKYVHVFDDVDKATSKTSQRLTYKGYTGTLKFICEIFFKDYKTVQLLAANNGNLKEALDKAPYIKNMNKVNYREIKIPGFKFNEDQEQMYKHYYYILERLFMNFNIKDEDDIQTLSLYFCYLINKMYTNGSFASSTTKIYIELVYIYTKICQNKIIEDIKRFELEDDDAYIFVSDPIEIAENEDLKIKMREALDTLAYRYRKVLMERFGIAQEYDVIYDGMTDTFIDDLIFDSNPPKTFDEVGKMFGLSRERVRQMEARALRNLRKPSKAKLIKDYR